MDEANALAILLRSGAGAAALRRLLDSHGSARAARMAGPSAWRAAGFDAVAVARAGMPDRRLRALDEAWLAQPGQRLLGCHDADYPPLLHAGKSPPVALWLRGDAGLLWRPQVAIVGSRAPSAGGCENAATFARECATAGLVVTSGLATGIDAAAHRGALAAGTTVAVLGNGPDECYPRSNAALFERIAERGCLVTEHPPGTPSHRSHFPSRNRIIATLSLGTLVVEAAMRSGALITAKDAIEAGREVFALPGSIHHALARGCHYLIRDGAQLVETPQEVVAALAHAAGNCAGSLRGGVLRPSRQVAAAVAGEGQANGNDPFMGILRAMSHDPVNLDQLCRRTGLTVAPLSAMLLALELEGKITAEHGRYTRRY
jgi:DNA processing protein